jgi:hypothetical protein
LTQRTRKVSFSSLGLRISAESTGTRVSVRISEPTMAKVMVSAIGLNSLPSRPVSENSGRNTTMMMRMAKAMGLITSRAASRMTWVRFAALPAWWESRRKPFSTITTAPSTIMPMPMASPASDIRLADRPKCCISRKAISMASGR